MCFNNLEDRYIILKQQPVTYLSLTVLFMGFCFVLGFFAVHNSWTQPLWKYCTNPKETHNKLATVPLQTCLHHTEYLGTPVPQNCFWCCSFTWGEHNLWPSQTVSAAPNVPLAATKFLPTSIGLSAFVPLHERTLPPKHPELLEATAHIMRF